MLNNPNTQTDPAEMLEDMADEYGHTPFILFDHRNNVAEYTGHFSAAPDFVNAMIAEAEPLYQAGNRIGVQAVMIELHCWLHALTMSDAWEMAQDTFIKDDWDDDWDDEDQDRSQDGDDDSPYAAMIRAMDRANEAIERYADLLTERRADDDRSEVACWRVMAMPCGHMAALEHHIARLRGEEPRDAESHNAALNVSLSSIAHALGHMDELRREKRAGVGPSKRAMNRRIGQVRSAMAKAAESWELITRTMSITFSDHVREDDQLRESARQLGEKLRGDVQPFVIGVNGDAWENSMVAYRNPNGSIRVKRIVDHYDMETDFDAAVEHAVAMQDMGNQLTAMEVENAGEFVELAQLIYDNAYGTLHNVDRGVFSMFLEELRALSDDPHAVREAALVAISDEYAATDLLFAQAETPASTVSPEKARSVIDAGRSAGLSEGQLRALAAAMDQSPDQLDVAPPAVSGKRLANALDLAPEPLSSRQVQRIAHLLGAELDEDVLNWIENNAVEYEPIGVA